MPLCARVDEVCCRYCFTVGGWPSIEAPVLNSETVSTFTPCFLAFGVCPPDLASPAFVEAGTSKWCAILEQQDQLVLARRERFETEPQVVAAASRVFRSSNR